MGSPDERSAGAASPAPPTKRAGQAGCTRVASFSSPSPLVHRPAVHLMIASVRPGGPWGPAGVEEARPTKPACGGIRCAAAGKTATRDALRATPQPRGGAAQSAICPMLAAYCDARIPYVTSSARIEHARGAFHGDRCGLIDPGHVHTSSGLGHRAFTESHVETCRDCDEGTAQSGTARQARQMGSRHPA
jgi:hypothetical protein